MAFNSNVGPKVKKKPIGSPWLCKCGITQPRYILFCSRCKVGQAKPA